MSAGSLVSLDVPIDSPPDMRTEVARRVDEVIGAVRPRWDPTAVRARASEMLGLCDEVERLTGERDAALGAVRSLRALCDEAAACLADALDCIREDVGMDEDEERAREDIIRRLRAAGGEP